MPFSRTLLASIGVCFLSITNAISLGCAASQSKNATSLLVTEVDKGRSVLLKQRQVLEVRLEAQPGTGYRWYVQPDSTQILKLIELSETKPEKPRLDGPVYQIFKFRADYNGNSVMRILYSRPWEKSKPPARSYELNISVE